MPHPTFTIYKHPGGCYILMVIWLYRNLCIIIWDLPKLAAKWRWPLYPGACMHESDQRGRFHCTSKYMYCSRILLTRQDSGGHTPCIWLTRYICMINLESSLTLILCVSSIDVMVYISHVLHILHIYMYVLLWSLPNLNYVQFHEPAYTSHPWARHFGLNIEVVTILQMTFINWSAEIFNMIIGHAHYKGFWQYSNQPFDSNTINVWVGSGSHAFQLSRAI